MEVSHYHVFSASSSKPSVAPENNTKKLDTTIASPTSSLLTVEEFKKLLRKSGYQVSLEGLNLVDAVLRLGIDYHFQGEIQTILQNQYMFFVDHDGDELYEVALRFRLLRQGGYYVSADVFNKFKDEKGKFNSILSQDTKGLMALFEASQLSIEEEHVLEEAEDFCRQNLIAKAERLNDHHQARIILNTLEQPYHKSVSRLTARNTLNMTFQGSNEWTTILQEVARMEQKVVQSLYQKELIQITKWWKELGLAEELKFARDQPLKWYLWTVACLTDPTMSEQRIELTKPISLIYIIDDIFDIHGTLEELTLFTEVVNKWEFSPTKELPDYMKICFKALDDITNEIANKVYEKHGWNPIESLKKSWAKLCNAFLVEAKWFASGSFPNEKEYLKTAIVSTGVHVVLVHMFFLMGNGITKEAVDILDQNNGGLISSTATILRLWDDLGNAKDENQDGHDGSYVDCYIEEHEGCSVKEARERVVQMIKDEWKSLNQECLISKPFPSAFKKACLDSARMVALMYNYDDDHRLPRLEDYMDSLNISGTSPKQGGTT
ncbi:hypothetical protein UlMin_011628 [Ulmus minor]